MITCAHCQEIIADADKLLLCSKCLLAPYCSENCATFDWIGRHATDHEYDEENNMDLVLGTGQHGDWGIWLGGIDALHDPNDIGHMDAVVSALGPNYPQKQIKKLLGNKIDAKRIVIWDAEDEDISVYFDEVADFIAKHVAAKNHLLIHCVAGHSRSVTLLVYYMMRDQGFDSVEDALQHLEKVRPTINPNRAFLDQLYRAEKRLKE